MCQLLFEPRPTGWGMSTNLFSLPVGTEFVVLNGKWDGEIVLDRNNNKAICAKLSGKIIEINSNLHLAIKIKE